MVLVDYTIRKFCIQSVSMRLPTEAGLRGEARACSTIGSTCLTTHPPHPHPQQLSQGETRLEAVPGRDAGRSLVGHRSESTALTYHVQLWVPLPVHLPTTICFPQPPLGATATNIRF